MAANYFTLLTKIGQASIANAVAFDKPLNLTYMAVGDGNGNPTTPNENQTALVREKYRAQINQLTIDPDNPNYLIAEMIVPTTVGGWSIYEVGVFDDQSQLVAVANFPATYKPELAEGSGRDLIVRIVIQVSNTSVVTLKVDPAVILASQAWVAANYVKKVTVAGGTTGQVLAKKSNANEDFKWVDPTAAVQVIVDSQVEEQTLTSGQTVVDLAKVTTQAVAIYVEGVRLYPTTHYTINSPTRLTLKTSYPGSSKLLAVQNDPTSTIAMASTTQKGFTQLSSATNSTSEALAATPKAVKAAYDLANGKYTAVDASLTGKGIVQLNSAINSMDETTAATPRAVKAAYDQANKAASTTTPGVVQLSNLINSVAENLAATPKAVKDAYDAIVGLLGSAAGRNVGNGANQIPDMSYFTSGSSGSGSWIKFPNGTLLQWGVITNTLTTGGFNVTYPSPFNDVPVYSLSVTSSTPIIATAVNTTVTVLNGVSTWNLSGARQTNSVLWIAVGK